MTPSPTGPRHLPAATHAPPAEPAPGAAADRVVDRVADRVVATPTRAAALLTLGGLALGGCSAVLDGVLTPRSAPGSVTARSSVGSSRGRTPVSAPGVAPDATAPAPPRAPATRVGRGGSRPRADRPVGAGFADRDASFAAAQPAPTSPPGPAGRQLSGPAAAARAAVVPDSALLSVLGDAPEEHLLRRATMGIAAGDRSRLADLGIDGWLTEQLDPGAGDGAGDAAWSLFPLAGADAGTVRSSIEEFAWDAMTQTAQATLARQLFTDRPLFEVVVDVLGAVLHVPEPFDGGWDVGPTYHQQVVRAHAYGRFEDMLLASMRHPAMLRFLNNDESHKDAVNENLGRELLELHTVGVGAGYTEADVRNSAYVLTGRTVDDAGGFVFEAERHWTGAVTVLDFSSPNGSADGGLEVGDDYLRHLAQHPATAVRIARALAVRFVSDDPPADLVDRLAAVYTDAGTAVLPVLEALFSSTEFWVAVGAKTRRPLESVVGAARAVGLAPGSDTRAGVEGLYWALSGLGHAPLAWMPPNGYPDVASAWSGAGGVLGRWNAHRGVVGGWWSGLTTPEPGSLVGSPVPATVGEYVRTLVRRLTGVDAPDPAVLALLGFLEAGADDAVGSTDLDGMAVHLAPLVLDSACFELR